MVEDALNHPLGVDHDREVAEAAPPLLHVELDPREARACFERLMEEVEVSLRHHIVHGDLSAYNILYWEGRARIIDLPQAVDARFNRNAFALLLRDVENVCDHFARYGIRPSPGRIARQMWNRYLFPFSD